ncbi:ABC transporter ATP-binding protein [[Clostridium] sordellii]|uniref:ABC-type transport system, multidrug-family ATP-binding protein n=1 Tax=Paraclostridium sordellii TaxID=1505 RepID=A0ABM9RQ65_PARSO|nr:ABC transporter ATP-binding protein [Paeniclostridium sordellii]CEJ73946.1 ABC-type transport system, multidrug-family ATP-binding protein [[Clostridium] sordellii] [Paeniclostridium sordellii]CEN69491.1 ABC transporter ATP-binding protein [[Clostridium] sordellii] [Paeniclostridium sordellii]CEN72759.1 ABC transporter ATP-binding protein [[Clostridium] sordellii] [Paeniclostridium sordellii]CEO24672.1 ABC transporter ATP-binding protein [[Clostridium] sordellii] [Paeniclostridium sordellii]
MNAIEIRDLSKRLNEFELNIDKLDIKKGYITGFVGPNGSGKTTTIKLIMNMLFKDSGSIKIFEKENDIESLYIKEIIGYVGETPGYMQDSKLKAIKKGISCFYKNWNENIYKRYIKQFKLDENKKYKEFSKGEQKKFELVMELSHNPKLIIMDEPTANLDPLVRNEFLDILQEHIEKEDATVFYSTHITSDLDKVADYLVFIFEGKVILYGDKESILENHKIIRGNKELLDIETKKELIAYNENSFGFEGLAKNIKSAYEVFGEEVIYDNANLEDILMYYTKEC